MSSGKADWLEFLFVKIRPQSGHWMFVFRASPFHQREAHLIACLCMQKVHPIPMAIEAVGFSVCVCLLNLTGHTNNNTRPYRHSPSLQSDPHSFSFGWSFDSPLESESRPLGHEIGRRWAGKRSPANNSAESAVP